MQMMHVLTRRERDWRLGESAFTHASRSRRQKRWDVFVISGVGLEREGVCVSDSHRNTLERDELLGNMALGRWERVPAPPSWSNVRSGSFPQRDGKDAGGSDGLGLGLARVRQDRGSAEQIHQPHPGLAEQVPNTSRTRTHARACWTLHWHCVISYYHNTPPTWHWLFFRSK